MAAPSSSLSSENGVTFHPYQDSRVPGPKGAYEMRQTRDGLYVRVDMPGVPPGGVKLRRYSETRTVTFTGRAPKLWASDSSERVYGGYVALDRDPTELEVEMTLKSGSLKLFFRNAEGSLHFFLSKKSDPVENSGTMIYCPCGDSSSSSSSEEIDCEPNVIIAQMGPMYRHNHKCSCCKGKRENALVYTIKEFSHINPYLLHGVQGVSEIKLVKDGSGQQRLYMRVDTPGLDEKGSILTVDYDHYLVFGEDGQLKKSFMLCGGNNAREHRLDERGRCYLLCVILQCSCCRISDVVQQVKDGVFRISFQKEINIEKATASSN